LKKQSVVSRDKFCNLGIFKIAIVGIISILITATTTTFSFSVPAQFQLSNEDEKFLDKVEHDAIMYFWEQANPENGLIKDSNTDYSPSSIAAVGFGLTALCIGVERGWLNRNEVYLRIWRTLRTFLVNVENVHGFFYHFLDMKSGKRAWSCEVSSIDTALFLAGALFAGEYFSGTEIEKIATQIYTRVDWPWMLANRNVLCMGWKPEQGFLSYYWDSYSELMIIYALAIGSPTHSIPADYWYNWNRSNGRYGNKTFIYCPTGSAFVYQYAHAWIDFKKISDRYANYWDNSVKALESNRQFCIDHQKDYETYGEKCWGLSACVGPRGYRGYGGGPGRPLHDGTVTPCAAAGSLPFMPDASLEMLKHIYDTYKNKVYGKYGFYDAFNIDEDWFCNTYIGIDQGITALMIENLRTGMVWSYFMNNKYVQKWVKSCMQEGT